MTSRNTNLNNNYGSSAGINKREFNTDIRWRMQYDPAYLLSKEFTSKLPDDSNSLLKIKNGVSKQEVLKTKIRRKVVDLESKRNVNLDLYIKKDLTNCSNSAGASPIPQRQRSAHHVHRKHKKTCPKHLLNELNRRQEAINKFMDPPPYSAVLDNEEYGCKNEDEYLMFYNERKYINGRNTENQRPRSCPLGSRDSVIIQGDNKTPSHDVNHSHTRQSTGYMARLRQGRKHMMGNHNINNNNNNEDHHRTEEVPVAGALGCGGQSSREIGKYIPKVYTHKVLTNYEREKRRQEIEDRQRYEIPAPKNPVTSPMAFFRRNSEMGNSTRVDKVIRNTPYVMGGNIASFLTGCYNPRANEYKHRMVDEHPDFIANEREIDALYERYRYQPVYHTSNRPTSHSINKRCTLNNDGGDGDGVAMISPDERRLTHTKVVPEKVLRDEFCRNHCNKKHDLKDHFIKGFQQNKKY
eukprot:Tbor_TRINITY_DN4749_c0_g1::TRINITY_DN4749_c0_g1_i2::g.17019::m.17019